MILSQSYQLLFANIFSDPYVRILMFNGSGRLVKKKKTTVKVRQHDKIFTVKTFKSVDLNIFHEPHILFVNSANIFVFLYFFTFSFLQRSTPGNLFSMKPSTLR